MWSAMKLACHNNVTVASDFETQKIPRSSSMVFDIPGAERLSLLSKGVGAEI
jgi:signal recognition particle receptor subunit beta